jgi:hypothetical protein
MERVANPAAMRTFTVVLAMTLHGCTVGSTEDVFEADTTEEAERLDCRMDGARAALRVQPLLVIERR